jgi:hypothetical protein
MSKMTFLKSSCFFKLDASFIVLVSQDFNSSNVENFFTAFIIYTVYTLFPLTGNGFAMWWLSVFRLPKFVDNVENCSFVQHLFVSHHIAKPMLAVSARLTDPMFLSCVASKASPRIV